MPFPRPVSPAQATIETLPSAPPDAIETATLPAGNAPPATADSRTQAPAAPPDKPFTDITDIPPLPPTGEDAAIAPPPLSPSQSSPTSSSPTSASPNPTPLAQVAQELHAIAARAEDGSVTVQLQPEELGRLHFQITRTAEGLHIHLSVDQPATLDLLRRHGADLLGDLRLDGFAGTTLSFAGNGPRDDRPAPPADPPPEAEPAPRISSFLPLPPGARTSGTLDLRL